MTTPTRTDAWRVCLALVFLAVLTCIAEVGIYHFPPLITVGVVSVVCALACGLILLEGE